MLQTLLNRLLSFKVPKLQHKAQCFSAILMLSFCLQILSGIAMAIHYEPSALSAFYCLHKMERNCKFGWLVRSSHHIGSSLTFGALYVHLFKNVYCRSYSFGRESTWFVGVLAFVLIIMTGFLGSVLPWGQISYWAAVVMSNFVEAIPFIGKFLKTTLLGGPNVGEATLKRCFVFHCILPFVSLMLVIIHIKLVHEKGQLYHSDCRLPVKRVYIPMYPTYMIMLMRACLFYLLTLCTLCTLFPDVFTNQANYYPANYLNTPPNIKPEWYFMPFFAMLKAFEVKSMGILSIILTFTILITLPYVHRFIPFWEAVQAYRVFVIIVSVSFVCLACLGGLSRTNFTTFFSRVCVYVFWLFFCCPIAKPIFRSVKNVIWRISYKIYKHVDNKS
ncbi:MAG: cytochrome bc complex cytochrome b subunit [Candidatus Hodgkinia cicadicola]